MRKFSLFLVVFGLLFIGCSSDNIDPNSCATCNMSIDKDSHFTAHMVLLKKDIYFDDIGCAVVYIDKHNIKEYELKVKTKDTHESIDAKDSFYAIDEQTPMNYGFVAYKEDGDRRVSFELMQQKMLRGENMTNPKIKKQLLGDKK
ncbi:MAG: hypothetical protein WC144_07385 [Sulfurimonas sp.]|jgi:hypothetical protein|nr:hypothetical protein [Sulfurimonadaceae bacterium]